MYTKEQIERGEGRMTAGRTTILQRGNENVFDTAPSKSGWEVRRGWHIAGSAGSGNLEWCDLR